MKTMHKFIAFVIAMVLCLSNAFPMTAKAAEDVVVSIEAVPAESEFIEHTGGEWYTNEETGESYYWYRTPSLETEGSQLTLHYQSGASKLYTFREDVWQWCSDDDEMIEPWLVSTDEDQATTPWVVGSENYFEVSYQECTTQVSVTIVENPIAELQFVPAEEIEIAEYTYGYWNDEEIQDYFIYGIPEIYQQDNQLIVTYKSGDEEIYVFDEDSWAWLSGDVELDDSYLSTYAERTDSRVWRPEAEVSFTLEYMGYTIEVPFKIVQNTIASIEFIPAEPFVYTECAGGEWRTDFEGNKFYYYWDYGIYVDGNQFILHYIDGTSKTFEFYSEPYEWIAEDGETLDEYAIDYQENQYENPWLPNQENYLTVSYMNHETLVPVVVSENPLESIEVTLAKPIEIVEHSDGYWSTDFDDNEFYEYSVPRLEQDGNQVSLYYKTGVNEVYTFNELLQCWESEDGEILDDSNWDFSSDQTENPWQVGKECYFTASYLGCETQIPVRIVKNPVESVEVVLVNSIEIAEYSDGTWADDVDGNAYFHYFVPQYKISEPGNQMIVNYTDGRQAVFVAQLDGGWVSDSGETLSYFSVTVEDDQEIYHWNKGDDNYITCYCLGIKTKVPVSIVENPVESIDFSLPAPTTIVEHYDGYWLTSEDGEDYYYYLGGMYGIDQAGAKLVVHYKTGESKTYIYDSEKYEWWTEDGERLDISTLQAKDDQAVKPWLLGEDNSFIVSYMGRETRVPITIIENTVQSISFVSAKPMELKEHTYGWWDDVADPDRTFCYEAHILHDGNQLILHYKDGTSKSFVYSVDTEAWQAADGTTANQFYFEVSDDQHENPWEVNNEYELKVSYLGHRTTVPVFVVEDPNPVVKLQYSSSSFTFAENTEGWFTIDDNGEHYWMYDYSSRVYEEGQGSISVTYLDGTKKIYYYGVDHGGPEYVSKDGEHLDWTLTWYDTQSEEHWTPDGDNYVTLYYRDASCRIPIIIGCDHELSVVKAKAATTTKDGYKQHYKCNDCGKYFADAAGTKETTLAAQKIYKASKISLKKDELVYNGKSQKPTVVVKDSKGKTISSSNYTVTVSKKKAIGKYTVKVTFKGKYYSGSKTLTWYIIPKTTKLSSIKAGSKSLTLKWSKLSGIKEYQIQYSTDKKFKKGVKTVTASAKVKTATIKKLKSKKTYYVRVRGYGSKAYGDWSKVKSVKVK